MRVKSKIILFVGMVCLPAFLAGAQSPDQARAAAAAMDALSAVSLAPAQAPAQAPAALAESTLKQADWTGPAQGIEETTGTLIRTNRRLEEEYRQLSEAVKATEISIRDTQQRIADRQMELKARGRTAVKIKPSGVLHGASESPDPVAELKISVARQQSALQASEAKIALLKLKVRELELEKRSVELDGRSRSEEGLTDLRARVVSARAALAAQAGQEKNLRKRIADLKANPSPESVELRDVLAHGEELKAAIALVDITSARTAAEQVRRKLATAQRDPVAARIILLEKQEAELRTRLTALQDRMQAGDEPPSDQTADDLGKRLAQLGQQNAYIARESENLRENIAVLESRVHALKNYTNRGKTRDRS